MLTALAITVVMLVVGWAAYGASIPGRTAPAFMLDVIVGAATFCCLGFAAACLIRNVEAVQPVIWATVLPLSFISGIFIATSELPRWLADIGYVFPVHPLAAALLSAYNPHTTGSGLNWGYLAILAAWGAAGLIVAVHRFNWLPRRLPRRDRARGAGPPAQPSRGSCLRSRRDRASRRQAAAHRPRHRAARSAASQPIPAAAP